MMNKRGSVSVKTVEIQTVKVARNLASKTGNPASEKADFARKFVEETRSRSRGLHPALKQIEHAR